MSLNMFSYKIPYGIVIYKSGCVTFDCDIRVMKNLQQKDVWHVLSREV